MKKKPAPPSIAKAAEVARLAAVIAPGLVNNHTRCGFSGPPWVNAESLAYEAVAIARWIAAESKR